MKRRDFMRAASAAAGLQAIVSITGCKSTPAPSANGLFPIRLQADWYPQPEQGGYFAAIANGIYKANGLEVTVLPLGQYTSGYQIVAGGDAEFGLNASDGILEAVSNGLPLIAVGATMQHDPQAVMVHQNSPVHTFADLDGHTIAAQPGATWFKYIVSKYKLKEARETPATHSIANFLADQNYIQQIFVTSEPYFVTKAGGTFRTMLISSAGYDPYRVFFTRKNFLEEHPDIVAKFVRATIQGWKEYLRDPGPANALIRKLNPQQNPDQMQYTLKALIDGGFITGTPNATPDDPRSQVGQMTAARWSATNEQLTSLGVIRNRIDPASAYTLKFLS